jgi:hypothetical protein
VTVNHLQGKDQISISKADIVLQNWHYFKDLTPISKAYFKIYHLKDLTPISKAYFKIDTILKTWHQFQRHTSKWTPS